MARSKYEIKAHKELQKSGCRVDYKSRPHRVPNGYNVDFFGLYDLLVLDKQHNLHLLAIKGHEGVPSKLRKGIADFKVKRIIKEIWIYKSNGLVKKEQIS